MTDFEFDTIPSPGVNRSAAVTDCATCGGDRLIPVGVEGERDKAGNIVWEREVYDRCPTCNPDPTHERPPVEQDAWWKK